MVVTLGTVMVDPDERLRREAEWLREEVAAARDLDDATRIAILDDLWHTAEAIRATETADQLLREERARQLLDAPGLERYVALLASLRDSTIVACRHPSRRGAVRATTPATVLRRRHRLQPSQVLSPTGCPRCWRITVPASP